MIGAGGPSKTIDWLRLAHRRAITVNGMAAQPSRRIEKFQMS